MQTITLDEARDRLDDVIARLGPGESVVITRGDTPVARLTADGPVSRQPRKAGSAMGQLVILAEDDDHLAHFSEYLG